MYIKLVILICQFAFVSIGFCIGQIIAVTQLHGYMPIPSNHCPPPGDCSLESFISMYKEEFLSGFGLLISIIGPLFLLFPFGFIAFYMLSKYVPVPCFIIWGIYMGAGEAFFGYPFDWMNKEYELSGMRWMLFIAYQQFIPLFFGLLIFFLERKQKTGGK